MTAERYNIVTALQGDTDFKLPLQTQPPMLEKKVIPTEAPASPLVATPEASVGASFEENTGKLVHRAEDIRQSIDDELGCAAEHVGDLSDLVAGAERGADGQGDFLCHARNAAVGLANWLKLLKLLEAELPKLYDEAVSWEVRNAALEVGKRASDHFSDFRGEAGSYQARAVEAARRAQATQEFHLAINRTFDEIRERVGVHQGKSLEGGLLDSFSKCNELLTNGLLAQRQIVNHQEYTAHLIKESVKHRQQEYNTFLQDICTYVLEPLLISACTPAIKAQIEAFRKGDVAPADAEYAELELLLQKLEPLVRVPMQPAPTTGAARHAASIDPRQVVSGSVVEGSDVHAAAAIDRNEIPSIVLKLLRGIEVILTNRRTRMAHELTRLADDYLTATFAQADTVQARTVNDIHTVNNEMAQTLSRGYGQRTELDKEIAGYRARLQEASGLLEDGLQLVGIAATTLGHRESDVIAKINSKQTIEDILATYGHDSRRHELGLMDERSHLTGTPDNAVHEGSRTSEELEGSLIEGYLSVVEARGQLLNVLRDQQFTGRQLVYDIFGDASAIVGYYQAQSTLHGKTDGQVYRRQVGAQRLPRELGSERSKSLVQRVRERVQYLVSRYDIIIQTSLTDQQNR